MPQVRAQVRCYHVVSVGRAACGGHLRCTGCLRKVERRRCERQGITVSSIASRLSTT